MIKNVLKGIIFLCIVAGAIYVGNAYNDGVSRKVAEEAKAILEKQLAEEKTIMDQFKIEDIKIGTGAEAVGGTIVKVHYAGTLVSGEEFDSSYKRGEPFSFVLGSGQVIAGWERGLLGMKVGGKRKLTIPPQLGYGDSAVGSIPAGSTLLFTVELLSVDALTPVR